MRALLYQVEGDVSPAPKNPGAKAETLRALRQPLLELAEPCHGDDRPEYPIIEYISGQSASMTANQLRK